MKTKKTLGLFAIALTALACALPGAARADGDIRSIEFYPEPEGGEVGVVRDLSRPLVAGDKVKFRIRLANRQWTDTDADHSFLNPWMLRSLAGAGAISNRLPQVGLRVSGGLRYADILSWDMADGDIHHTDLICQYTVQAGDFALPLKLSNSKGTAPAMEADPADPSVTPDTSGYYFSNNNLWGFFPQTPTDNVTSNRLKFFFGPERLDPGEYPGADLYRESEVRDYDLSGANIQIKAIDFDSTYADEANGVWRNVAAGTTTATPAVPRLSVPGGASGAYRYYVWTKDSTVAEVENGTDYTFADGVTRKVATVTVNADDELAQFVIRAKAGQVGNSTEVYMSDTPTNIYKRAGLGSLITNFTTRVIKIVEPPPPSISVVLDPASGVVSTSTNNYLSVATLDVELSEPWTQDVTVLLTPSMSSGSGTDPFTYIGMSTARSGAEYYDGQVVQLTVKAGNTKASDGGTMLYVYANRANADTAKGIRFMPSIDPASANSAAATAFFTGGMTPNTLQINSSKPVITAPTNGQEYFNIPANTPTDFTISVADAMWNLHGKTADDGKYTVYIDYNGSGSYEAISNLTANASGEITFQYRYIVGGRDYTSKIYVENQDGLNSKDSPITYTVHVNVAKKVEVTADNPRKTYCEGDNDPAELSFKFTEPFDYVDDAFVFLEPANDQSRDLVECDAFEFGIPISVGSTEPIDSAHLTFKDGWRNCAFKYNVVVRSTDDPTDDTNIISVWGSDGITLYVTNAIPTVLSLSMNSTPADVSGGTLTAKAAVGVQNMFEVSVWDESYDVDLETNEFETVVKFWENGAVAKTVTLRGNPNGQQIPYTFSTGGDGVRNKVTVHVYDKDMTTPERLAVDKNPFTVFVETVDAPAISLSPDNSSPNFLESDTGSVKGRINVDLTVPPTGLGTGHITVKLEVESPADGAKLELSTDTLEFRNNISQQSFFFKTLDGTMLSDSDGFRIRARVIDTTQSVDASKTWADYYQSAELTVFVANEAPQIGPGIATTNEIPVAINVPYTITWNAKDIEIDQQQLIVTWTYNGGSETTIENMVGKTGKKEVVFTSSGSKTVSLMVQDKDGGFDTREYYFYVAPSKLVEIHPRQPGRLAGRSDGVSKLSKKFTGALGIGDGRVWADGASGPTEITDFVHKWSYSPEDLKTTVYARGYKYKDGVGETDNGSLTPGKDFAIAGDGSAWQTGRTYYQYVDLERKDSFFYCWILNTAGGESGYEGTHLNGTVQPEIGVNSLGRQEVALPEYDDSAVTYDATVLEAIFSLEYLRSDNLGDINQDGIPDIYAADTQWQNGALYAAAGFSLDDEDPGDLKKLGSWNDDAISTKSGSELGDFLPSASSSGTSLIPNLVNWATAGGKFTAMLELRGFDENLNYRVSNSGLNRNVRGTWVSDPNFSRAEWISLAYHNPACGVDLAASTNWVEDVATVSNWVLTADNAWIPENRTDPTVDDTDEDGFPDGYEYYFWYSAAVGEVNAKGEWVRLSGSKFSLDDIATGVELTPDEVAAAFNPTVAFGGKADERDTDNDGLTDLEEFAMGTNPINWDSDGDGLSDFWEIMNGMNPLENSDAEGADMNADGDFMARWDSEAAYAIATFKMPDGTVREYAVAGNYGKYFEVTDEKTGAATLTEDAKTNQFVAISVFRYGNATNGVCVPRFRGGAVTNTVDNFGEATEAKPLDALVWDLGEATNDDVVVTLKFDQKIALIHDQVNAQFGFDPRTGWNNKDGFVADRWKSSTKGSENEGDSGKAVNTVKYTALDEYLLLKYRYETNKEMPDGLKLLNYRTGTGVPYSSETDAELWNGTPNRRCGEVFLYGTTAPNIAFDNPDWVVETTTMGDATFSSELHGADTDQDGVPDGWELYVKHNPNSSADDDTKDQDGDNLNLVREYAGTDSCNAYATCETVITNHPGLASGWYNKFFPTNPEAGDTDGDGIADDQEGATWKASVVWGNGATGGDAALTTEHTFSFIYGPNEGKPEGDDGSVCIRGGGLNPCSVDTDGDCLPDPWERQFAGPVFGPGGKPEGALTLEAGVLQLIRRSDGLANGAATNGYYITAGMDGTFKKDAWTDPTYTDPATGTVRDFDFDHDGLQNFQEYLVQALRHLRYDDSSTPLMGQWMPSGGPASLQYFGFLPMNIMDGETFYAKVKKAGYPATGAWNFRDLGYFARPPHEWDKAALNTSTKDRLAYDEMGFRVMLRPKAVAGAKQASGYCSTDPRNWDSDGDGMDDYYELFHGLNPLLGEVAGGTIVGDVIALAYGGQVANWYNAWTGWPMTAPEDPVYDAMRFPWMMGTPGCDADGDGLNNYEEALLANMTSPQPTHTDPTPLWMTDSSSLNNASFVSQYYKMDCDALQPDLRLYPWTANDPDGFLFAFEENEGYDTDHDGISDSEEKKLTTTALSDPLDFSDPDRRQALWFPGDKSAAVSYACTPGNSSDVAFDSFRQFTVEAWVKPEDVARDQVIVERAVTYLANTLSNNVSKVRANFRLGIMADGRLYGLFDTSDAVETDTEGSSAKVAGAKIAESAWTHIALTFNGAKLALFMNGRKVGELQTTLVPANGIVGVTQQPVPGGDAFPAGSGYTFYTRSAMVLGASALNADAVVLAENTEWACYGAFFKGFVDEVRVWDGAKTETELAEGYKTRLSVSDAKTLRQAVYAAWADGATRNDNDTNSKLPVELVFHYGFSTLPGAVEAADVMWEPSGFTKNVLDNVRVGGEEVPGDLYCGWWKSLPVHSTVYRNYRWVPWVPNMVAHLPPMDGLAVDSQYWAERLAGVCAPGEATGAEAYLFPNTMNPYTFYHNNGGNDVIYYNNRLVSLAGQSSVFAETYSLFKFEKRTASLGSTDLLPLGGAFAKRVSALWDGEGASDVWTYTGDDLDGNGLPDWWEAQYMTGDPLTLETLVEWNGQWITAREAYLRDLAAGLQPNGTVDADYKATADRDHDGLPDWWENLYGIADESGEDDHDGDGLSNFAEYLIAECFSNYGFPRVRPDQARTFVSDGQLVTDYFLTKGQLYLGEMFADHDFCEDAWEDLYATRIDAATERLFASRYVHDMWDDNDEDGWSNFAECRAGTDPTRARTVSYVSGDFPEFPISTVRATIRYNGSKVTAGGTLVLRSYSGASVKGKPDATWKLSAGGSSTQGGSSSSSSGESSGTNVGAPYVRQLGLNPGTSLSLNLGSGTVVPGTVCVYFRDLTSLKVEEDGSGLWLSADATSWCAGLRDIYTGLETKTANLAESASGQAVGSINYETGDVTIDFPKLNPYLYKGDGIYTWTSPGVSNAYERLDVSRSFVRIEWRGQVVASENTWNATLAQADDGHLREGVNTFEVFLDLNGDGLWTPGEPYGVASDVDVGWSSATFALELTDVAPQMFRIDMQQAVQANDFDGQKSLNDRGVANSIGVGSNRAVLEESVGLNMPAGTETETRVRIVRTAVNDVAWRRNGTTTRYADGVVLDVTRDFTVNPYLTECDLVKTGDLDLDWGHLGSIASALGEDFQNITSAVYRVVLGDGTISPTQPTNNNCLATAFINIFERGASGAQTRCEPVSPKGTVMSAQPTFRWRHDNAIGKAYPAFRLRVRKGNALVYDSGAQRAPARDVNGVYSWTAPIYVDMVMTNGVVFANTNNYTWSVSMLDAKFTAPNTSETAQEFRMEVPAKLGSLSDYGELTARVHYFGPATTSNKAGKGLVRVQAFTSPDFTGMPAGEATLLGMDGLDDVNGEGCVAVIRGLPAGTYYVRSYVDSDGDAAFSKWESWGYACYVGDGDAKGYAFTPKAFVVAKGAAVPEAEVFVEDMDTDNDGLPDAWEFAEFGTLDQRSSPSGSTFFTKVNPDLAATVSAYLNLADGGLRMGSGYAAMTLMNALVADDAASLAGLASLISGQPQPAVSETVVVRIDSFSLTEGMTASVSTTVTGAGDELVIPASEATVGVWLVASAAIDFSNAASVKVKSLKIRANAQTTATVSAEEVRRAIEAGGLNATSFFKVKLVQE